MILYACFKNPPKIRKPIEKQVNEIVKRRIPGAMELKSKLYNPNNNPTKPNKLMMILIRLKDVECLIATF